MWCRRRAILAKKERKKKEIKRKTSKRRKKYCLRVYLVVGGVIDVVVARVQLLSQKINFKAQNICIKNSKRRKKKR